MSEATSNPNPFAQEWDSPWETSTSTVLRAGNHKVKIVEIDGSGNSSGQHPQIEVKVGNGSGEIRDWIVVIPATIGRVNQLLQATGITDPPPDGTVTPEGSGYRFDEKYLEALVGKELGVIVRQEPDYKDPSKMRDRVQGYVPVSQLGTDVPGDMDFMGDPVESGKAEADAEIPF